MQKFSIILILLAPMLIGCGTGAASPTSANTSAAVTAVPNKLDVGSAAFDENAIIPKKYTCDGENVSPALKWGGAPSGTQSYALVVDDPDAPSGSFVHWVAFDIPASQTEIAEGTAQVGKAGHNGRGQNGYTGPCPPSGTHHYYFTVYALDVPSLKLNEGATRDQVTQAMAGHILAQGSLIGRYGR